MSISKKSIITFASVLVVSLGLLFLFNFLFPGYIVKIDPTTRAIMDEFMHTDDYNIFDGTIEGYDNLIDFNNANGDNAQVTQIYVAVGGDNDGNFIIQTTSRGYASNLVILTGYTEQNTILGTRLLSGAETAPSGVQAYDRPEFFDSFQGKGGNINPNDILAESGATASVTTRGYVYGVNLATQLATILNSGEVPPPTTTLEEPSDKEKSLLANFNDETYQKASKNYLINTQILTAEQATSVVAVYIGDNNTIIYEAKGGGSYDVSLMIRFDGDKIAQVMVGTTDNIAPDPEGDGKPAESDKVIEKALQLFVGKTLEEIQILTSQDLDANSGATYTAQSVLNAAIQTFAVYNNAHDKILAIQID